MKLLLTGFEPFDGGNINPSQLVAERLACEGLEGMAVTVRVLPVDTQQAPGLAVAEVTEVQPDVVIMLGLASSRPVLAVERVAINLLDFRIPDNAGQQVVDGVVAQDGPAAYFATLPVRRMVEAAQAAGVPAELSLSAGAYLCNQVMYAALHAIAVRGWAVKAGFVHLPALPEMAVGKAMASMCLEDMLTGVRAMALAAV